MNDYPETIPIDCRLCSGECEDYDSCPKVCDDMSPARGIVWCWIACLALWFAAITAFLA